jgi:hypothetical protein
MTEQTKQTLKEVASILDKAGWKDDHSINIRGNVTYSQVGQSLNNCTNLVQSQPPGERRDLLEQLRRDVTSLIERLPDDRKEEAADNLEMLVKQATAARPNRSWYSVSADGLLDASNWVKDFAGNLAETIGALGKSIWPDFLPPERK